MIPDGVALALSKLARVLFILAIPTFLVTSNVRLAFDSLSLYGYGFEQHNVVGNTGLNMDQLMSIAAEIIHYFNSSEELLDVKVFIGENQFTLFNHGEVLHMRDVKGLLQAVHKVQLVTGIYILGTLLIMLVLTRGTCIRMLAGQILTGSLLSIILLLLGGLGSVLGFDQIFDQFHALSFNSGTYTFDPRYNYLTRLFTEGFFMQATLFISLSVTLQALLLALLAFGIRRVASNKAISGAAT